MVRWVSAHHALCQPDCEVAQHQKAWGVITDWLREASLMAMDKCNWGCGVVMGYNKHGVMAGKGCEDTLRTIACFLLEL